MSQDINVHPTESVYELREHGPDEFSAYSVINTVVVSPAVGEQTISVDSITNSVIVEQAKTNQISVSFADSVVEVLGVGSDQSLTATAIRALGFFDRSNDGSGSGLDADLLDGNHASAFATADHQHPHTHDYEVIEFDENDQLWYDRAGDRWYWYIDTDLVADIRPGQLTSWSGSSYVLMKLGSSQASLETNEALLYLNKPLDVNGTIRVRGNRVYNDSGQVVHTIETCRPSDRAVDNSATYTPNVWRTIDLGSDGTSYGGVSLANAKAVLVHITVVASGAGNLAVKRYGSSDPDTANLNYTNTHTTNNLVWVELDSSKRFQWRCQTSNVTRIIIDIVAVAK